MTYDFSTLGVIIGMALAIFLIVKQVNAAYSLILGALVAGVVGSSGDLVTTVNAMITGGSSMISAVLRILTSGVLAGALIKTGAAERIAQTIIDKLGQKMALVSIAIATMIICAVGVFIDIAVITVAPIGLSIGKRAGYNKASLLIAMIGGGKAGNIISPNPNTIALSDAFKLDITSLMMANIIPAICALIMTVVIATALSKKQNSQMVSDSDIEQNDRELPSFIQAIIGPIVVVILLALRPLCGYVVDPLVALPCGGLVCSLACGAVKDFKAQCEYGLSKVVGIGILLIGTGTIAGVIQKSALQYDVIHLLDFLNMPAYILAPFAGILMAGATASTTAGSTIAGQTFGAPLVEAGIPALSAAAMIHCGATVIDSLPHGSFCHATGGAASMNIKDRMKLIPFEAMIGLTSTIVSVIIYLI